MSLVLVALEDGRFRVPDEARQFLQSKQLCDKRLAVVSLAGPYRHGKSTLLNRVVLQNPPSTGFTVGQSVNACTKGLHMSTKLLPNSSDPDALTLIVDTEGLGATTANQNHDTNIFALALLCSSLFMYNSKGTIDQSSIDMLALVTRIVREFRRQQAPTSSKSKRARKDNDVAAVSDEEMSKMFPTFMWVVRDFALDLVKPDGKTVLTANGYLEEALAPVADPDKNEVRQTLRTMFRHRDCFLMCRPVGDEDLLKTFDSQPESVWDPRFLDQAARLRERIQMFARVKQLDSQTYMTGSLLVQLLDQYCAALNEQRLPVVRDAWYHISRERCQQAVKEAMDLFCKRLADEAPTRAKLEAAIAGGFNDALALFQQRAIGNSADALQELRQCLNKAAGEHRQRLVQRLSDQAVAVLKTVDTLVHNNDVKTVGHLVTLVRTKHSEFTDRFGRDPETQAAWNQECLAKLTLWAEAVASVVADQLIATQQQLTQAQTSLDQIQGELAESKQETDALRPRVSDLESQYATAAQRVAELQPAADASTAMLARIQELEGRAACNEDLDYQLQMMTKETKQYAVDLQVARHTADKLTANLEQTQKSCQKLEADAVASADAHRRDLEQLQTTTQATLADLRASKDAAVQRSKQAQADAETARAAASKLQAELERAHNNNQASMAQTIQQLKSEHQVTVQKLEMSRQELASDFQRRLADMKAESLAARQQREAEARAKMQDLSNEKTLLETKYQTVLAELHTLKMQHQIKTEEAGTLRTEARAAAVANSNLQTQLAAVQARSEMREKTLAESQQQLAALGERLSAADEELRQIRQQHQAEMLTTRLCYESQISRMEDQL